MDLVPLEADDVGEQPLGKAVLAHHAGRQAPALGGHLERSALRVDVAVVLEPAHHLGHRGRGVAQALGEAGADHGDLRLLQLVHRLEVLLDRRVEPGRHAFRLLAP
jgi:hypothetical protein